MFGVKRALEGSSRWFPKRAIKGTYRSGAAGYLAGKARAVNELGHAVGGPMRPPRGQGMRMATLAHQAAMGDYDSGQMIKALGMSSRGALPPPPRNAKAAARSGSKAAHWVKNHKGMMAGGAAVAGGMMVAHNVTKSGNGTDKTGFRQSRGMYMY